MLPDSKQHFLVVVSRSSCSQMSMRKKDWVSSTVVMMKQGLFLKDLDFSQSIGLGFSLIESLYNIKFRSWFM